MDEEANTEQQTPHFSFTQEMKVIPSLPNVPPSCNMKQKLFINHTKSSNCDRYHLFLMIQKGLSPSVIHSRDILVSLFLIVTQKYLVHIPRSVHHGQDVWDCRAVKMDQKHHQSKTVQTSSIRAKRVPRFARSLNTSYSRPNQEGLEFEATYIKEV